MQAAELVGTFAHLFIALTFWKMSQACVAQADAVLQAGHIPQSILALRRVLLIIVFVIVIIVVVAIARRSHEKSYEYAEKGHHFEGPYFVHLSILFCYKFAAADSPN
jgi:hypothetical protein